MSLEHASITSVISSHPLSNKLQFNTAKTIGTSFVYSRLDFCNFLYYGLPKKLNWIAVNTSRTLLPVLLLLLLSDADLILKSLHWLRVQNALNIKLHLLLISFSSIPFHYTFAISSLCSLQGPPDPHRWSLSSTRSFSLVSKSPINLSATQHPISGKDFLHHLDYHVPPLHPLVVLHSLNLLLACLIWCSTLVSKIIFSPGPYLHSFSH